MEKIEKRLAHAMALSGVASRRASELLIAEGRVKVNGALVTRPMHKVVIGRDRIEVNGRRIKEPEKRVYFLLNKPSGMLCTHEPGPAKTVAELFSHLPYRLFTVGRLDQATEGLIIVTNDGSFAHRVMHPSYGVQKEYLAKVSEEVTPEALAKVAAGIWIEGTFVKPLMVRKVRRGTLKIVVGEGKKHEVRELIAHGSLTLKELTRIRLGPLHLGHLAPGSYRELSQPEIDGFLEKKKSGRPMRSSAPLKR